MQNRQSPASYDAEFLLKASASLLVVSFTFMLLYANRNYLLNTGRNVKNSAGNVGGAAVNFIDSYFIQRIKARLFKTPDNAPPAPVPYKTISGSLTLVNDAEEKAVVTTQAPRSEHAPVTDAPASNAPAPDSPASDAPTSDAPASDATVNNAAGTLQVDSEKDRAASPDFVDVGDGTGIPTAYNGLRPR
jgi:hypothetical protein